MAYTPTRLAEEETLEAGQTQTTSPKLPKKKRPRGEKRGKKLWLLIPVILVALLAAALAAAYRGVLPVDPGILPDLNAKTGTLHADEPDAEVPVGTYRFVLNQQPVMTAGARTCNIELENVPANHFSVQCDLLLEETGETLWSGNRLSPGRYIETAELSRTFEVGEFPLTLHYRFFDGTEEIGTQDIAVTLYVQAAE